MKKTLLIQCFMWLLVCVWTVNVQAQKEKDPKGNNTNKTANTGKDGKDDKSKTQPTSAKSNTGVSEKVLANLESMSREEKNTMTTCPMHGQHMDLSDNYRANASDYRESGNYPFAYQLNYRRYCKKCTQALEAEDKAIAKADRRDADEPTFERCTRHNETMFINGEHRPMQYETSPSEETPFAQAYGFKYYCKTCNKIHKSMEKSDSKKDEGSK